MKVVAHKLRLLTFVADMQHIMHVALAQRKPFRLTRKVDTFLHPSRHHDLILCNLRNFQKMERLLHIRNNDSVQHYQAAFGYGVRMRNTPRLSATPWATFCRAARENAGLSKASLARTIGVDRATVGRWEDEGSLPASGAVVTRFAVATGVSVDEARQAAGIIPADDPPALPSTDDEELRIIRESEAPERVKKALVDYVLRRRAEQTRERIEQIEMVLKNRE